MAAIEQKVAHNTGYSYWRLFPFKKGVAVRRTDGVFTTIAEKITGKMEEKRE